MTQGKSRNDNERVYGAGNAIDKDLSTLATALTKNGLGWLKLQFDRINFIHMIIIYYRFYTGFYKPSATCAKSEKNFKDCVEIENNVDVSVYQG